MIRKLSDSGHVGSMGLRELYLRKRVEQDINQVLASAMLYLPEAVLLTEPASSQILFLNPAFQRLTGYSLEELQARGLDVLRGPETDPSTLDRLLHPSAVDESTAFDLVVYRKGSVPFWDHVSIRLASIEGRVYCLQTHANITQQHEMEQHFILSQRREATNHLVSGLAHDFNNLLTAILVYSGLMAPKVANDRQVGHFLDEIRGAAQSGAQLVSELMNLGRQDPAEPETLDLRELVDESAELLKRVLGEDIQLKVVADVHPNKVRVHPGRLQQILLNLAINSRDAMPQGGELLIRWSSQYVEPCSQCQELVRGNYVVLLVIDTGVGMGAETCSKIFQPFFTTKSRDKGTGLGLFTVKRIVEQYGGGIMVESAPGKGTAFKILLPAIG